MKPLQRKLIYKRKKYRENRICKQQLNLSVVFYYFSLQFIIMLDRPESKWILNALKNNSAPDLFYHSLEHTLDVYEVAKFLSVSEKISRKDEMLLLIAALYHDSGYLFQREEHENKSCELVREKLPEFGYAPHDIEIICGIIQATKIPQLPKTHLEQLICDADLDYLGRDDFFSIGERLYLELKSAQLVFDKNEWNKLQLVFLQKHQYFTQTAKTLRTHQKQQNLKAVLAKITENE